MITIRRVLLSSLIRDSQWWRHVFRAAVEFAPRCIPCAMAMAIANILFILTTAVAEAQLAKLKAPGLLDSAASADILQPLVYSLGCFLVMIVSLLISLAALSDWLVKLTAFSRILIRFNDQWSQSEAIDWKAEISSALKETKNRGWYLMKLWLVASAILLVPSIPMCMLISFKVLAAEPMMLDGIKAFGLDAWITDPRLQATVSICAFVLTVIVLLYSLVTIAFSAVSELSPLSTALAAFRQSLRHLGPLLIITTAIIVVNTLVTAPQSLLALVGVKSIADSCVGQVCAQIWFAASSLVIWPLSMAPYCRLTSLVDARGDS
jgi:hypothetical protein